MIGNKFLSVTGGEPVDAQFNYVTMLLKGDGTNGGTNNTILDSSPSNLTISNYGTPGDQGTFSPYSDQPNNWSSNFKGDSGGYFVTPSFNTGTGDITWEGWLFASTTGNNGVFTHNDAGDIAGGFSLVFQAGNWTFSQYNGSIQYTWTGGSAGVWLHFALVLQSSVYKLYVNGILLTRSGSSGYVDRTTTTATRVGTRFLNGSANNIFSGYIKDFRIKTGAVYTSNFTRPTAPLTSDGNTLLLTCQANGLYDKSSYSRVLTSNGVASVFASRFSPFIASPSNKYSASTISGSLYFNGSAQIFTSTSISITTSWTMEAWVYLVSGSGSATIVNMTAGTNIGPYIYLESRVPKLGTKNTKNPTNFISGTYQLEYGTWYHIAASRSGNTRRLFVNGVLQGTHTAGQSDSSDASVKLGSDFVGYQSDTRVVVGSTLYTSTFTPPTAPLTAVSNTKLLLSATNSAVYDSAMHNNLKTVTGSQISTSVKKYGTGSISFNGSGYLYTKSSMHDGLRLGVGGSPFTLEMWINPTAIGTDGTIIERFGGSSAFNSSNGVTWILYKSTDNRVYFRWWTGSTDSIASTSAGLTANTWHHIAVVYNGTTTTVYLNGSSTGGSTSTTGYGETTGPTQVRIGLGSGFVTSFNGYIDDLRITKGYARYTANFTAPTAGLPEKG